MALHFVINKQELIRTDKEILASYTKNFIKCKFCCPDKWSDLYKYALFINIKGQETIVELGLGEKVQCHIPENILTGNFFYISVFADDRLTTTQQLILIQPSGLSEQIIRSFNEDDSSVIVEDIDTVYRTEICECDSRYRYDPEHLYF